MEKPSEKGIRPREQRSVDEKTRWNVLVIAAVLLVLAFPPVVLNVSDKPLFIAAFLVPCFQIAYALYGFPVVRESTLLNFLSLPFGVAVFGPTQFAQPSPLIWLLLSCVYIISAFAFEFGLGMSNKIHLSTVYAQLALNYPITMEKVSGREMSPGFWALTLAPLPLTLILMVLSVKYGVQPAAEPEIVRK